MSDRRAMFQYSIDPAALTLAAAAGGTGTKQTTTLQLQGDSWFVCQKLICNATSMAFDARIYGGSGSDAAWSNAAVNAASLFGTAQRPLLMHDPFIIDPGTALTFELEDRSGAANTVEIVLEGYKDFDLSKRPTDVQYRAPYPMYRHQFFQYVDSTSVNASNSSPAQIRIQSGSMFVVRQIMALSNVGLVAGTFQVRISDSGSGRQYSANLVNDANFAGTAQYPRVLHEPISFEPNSVVSVEYTDTSAATNPIQLVLTGTKIFRPGM